MNMKVGRIWCYGNPDKAQVQDEDSYPTTKWDDWVAKGFASLTINQYLIEDLGPTGYLVMEYFMGRMDKMQGQIQELKRYLDAFSQSL